LANRRRFEEYLRQQWNLMLRDQHPLSLILCDLDFFKYYNDTYGHQAGDNCLQQVAAAISYEAKRPSDLVARYGGEELVLILPNTDSYGAMNVAKRIREQVSELKIQHLTSTVNDYVTLSLGIACVVPQLNLLPADLIEAADKALYQAKHEGRDRAIVYTF
jgi:diguanylate cyclase (GGDEF)-like protein